MEEGTINILSIECAIGRGSVAVMRGETLLSSSDGSSMNPSRAEDILAVIHNVVSEAGLDLRMLGLIAVSTGPGSYSGIRIGIATGLGLANSLGIKCSGISLLEAIASDEARPQKFITAVPVGKNDVAWLISGDASRTLSPLLEPFSDFIDRLKQFPEYRVLAQGDLFARLSTPPDLPVQIEDVGTNLAFFVGRSAALTPAQTPPTPIYLRNQSHSGRGAQF
jgi:tRNA threonylcarbamoyl adenosine modification protein YeaZ